MKFSVAINIVFTKVWFVMVITTVEITLTNKTVQVTLAWWSTHQYLPLSLWHVYFYFFNKIHNYLYDSYFWYLCM